MDAGSVLCAMPRGKKMSDCRLPCGCRVRNDGSFSNICIDHQKEQALEDELKEWREAREVLYEENQTLRSEVERLNLWVEDIQSGMYINCVYCGHRYGPRETTPVSMADALKEHIEQCPKHPMSELRARVRELEDHQLRTTVKELEDHQLRTMVEELEDELSKRGAQ